MVTPVWSAWNQALGRRDEEVKEDINRITLGDSSTQKSLPFTSSRRAPISDSDPGWCPEDFPASWTLLLHWLPKSCCKRSFLNHRFHWLSSLNWEPNMVPIANCVHLSARRPSLDQLFYISLVSTATSQYTPLLSQRVFPGRWNPFSKLPLLWPSPLSKARSEHSFSLKEVLP